jgi:hypothetical protein
MDGIAKNPPRPPRWHLPTIKPTGPGVEMNQLIVGRVRQCSHGLQQEAIRNCSVLIRANYVFLVGPAWLSHERRLEECGGGERAGER